VTPGTLVVVNARVRTADPRRVADGVVVRDGVVVLVGASAEARKLGGAGARVVDARGGTVTHAGGAAVVRGAPGALELHLSDGTVVPVDRTG
jgi:hypothetical protein